MFKLAVISDEISQDPDVVVAVCRDYEVPAVEIRSVWDKPPQQLTDGDIGRLRHLLAAAGLSVCSIASPFFKCHLGNADEYRQHLDLLRRCLALAQAFDCRIIRGFTFWRDDSPLDSVYADILKSFAEPLRLVADAGVFLGIENEASTFIGSAAELQRFLCDLNSPWVQAVWDPANHVYAGADEPAFPDGYQRLKPWMLHVHVKDVAEEDGRLVCAKMGEGLIDYPGQLQALVDDGYNGYVSLETHWRPQALSEDLLDRPGGAAFSASGEEATRACLDSLRQLIATLRT